MRWLVLIALAGCYNPRSPGACAVACEMTTECPGSLVCTNGVCTTASGDCNGGGDGGMDAEDAPLPPLDVFPANCAGLPGGLFPNLCNDFPLPPQQLSGPINTNTSSPQCQSQVAPECVIAAESIVVVGSLDVVGTRPLVLWSASTIEIKADVDAASRRGSPPGPASNPACGNSNGDTSTGVFPTVGAGGAGGSHAASGGVGGNARSGATTVVGPTATAGPMITTLRGGCRGGTGGAANGTNGPGGDGGGAIYVMARDQIVVASTIDVSGAAGAAGKLDANGITGGGGGGGAGGSIWLDAPTIAIASQARLLALGGGGGSGAGFDAGDVSVVFFPANPGEDGAQHRPAAGGLGNIFHNSGGAGCSDAGGTGVAGGNLDSSAANQGGGGGGGGGGPGFIVGVSIAPIDTMADIAPPLTRRP